CWRVLHRMPYLGPACAERSPGARILKELVDEVGRRNNGIKTFAAAVRVVAVRVPVEVHSNLFGVGHEHRACLGEFFLFLFWRGGGGRRRRRGSCFSFWHDEKKRKKNETSKTSKTKPQNFCTVASLMS